MSSAAQIAANRRNAKHSTGPTSAEGKARSSGNARRHGLTARLPEGAPVTPRAAAFAAAFLGDHPATEATAALAREAGEAQEQIEAIAGERLRLIKSAECDASLFTEHCAADTRLIRATLKAAFEGKRPVGGDMLQDLLWRHCRPPPRDPLRRYRGAYLHRASELQRLHDYERRAHARRRKALAALDRELGSSGAAATAIRTHEAHE